MGNPDAILQYAAEKAQIDLPGSYERVAMQLTSNDLLAPSRDWLPSLGIACTWITPIMREALAERAKALAREAPNLSFSAYSTQQAISDSGDAHRHLRMLAEQHNKKLIGHYLGESVLRPVIALPAPLRMQPGQFKPLLQAASKAVSLVPAGVYARTSKGSYSAQERAGFKDARPGIVEELKYSPLVCMGFIDLDAVLTSLTLERPPLSSLAQLRATNDWIAYLGIEAPRARLVPTRHRLNKNPPQQNEVATAAAPVPLSEHYALPSALHIATAKDGKLVAFNHARGTFLVLPNSNRTTQLIIQTLAKTNSPQLTLEVLKAHYPNVSSDQLATDLRYAIRDLTDRGWFQPVDAAEIRVRQISTLKLPQKVAERIITYVQSLDERTTSTDAHHFASMVTGNVEDMLKANNRAADIVRTGEEISAEELPIGVHGVVGVLRSRHGLAHGLQSVIGLGNGGSLSVIAEGGNVAVGPINNFVTYYKGWLASIGFFEDVEKVRLYAKS